MQLIVLCPTISGTWEFALRMANTLEQAQIVKLSFAPEKGDEICGGLAYVRLVYSILYTVYNFIIYIPIYYNMIFIKSQTCIQFFNIQKKHRNQRVTVSAQARRRRVRNG